MPEQVKSILGNNQNFLTSADGAKNALNAWNLMTPTQKALTAQNLTAPDVNLAQQTVNSLTGNNVQLDATNNTLANVIQANANVNSVKQIFPTQINAQNNTSGPSSQAISNVNSVPNRNVTISATDHASGVAGSVRGALYSIPTFIQQTIVTGKQIGRAHV